MRRHPDTGELPTDSQGKLGDVHGNGTLPPDEPLTDSENEDRFHRNFDDAKRRVDELLDEWYDDDGTVVCVAECGKTIESRENVCLWGQRFIHVKCLAKHVRRWRDA